MPTATAISDIVTWIADISKTAIPENGGRMELQKGNMTSIANKTIPATYNGVEYTWQFGESETVTVSGGDLEEDTSAEFVQDGERVRVQIFCDSDNTLYEIGLEGFYDGKNIEFVNEIEADIFWDDMYGKITYIINCDF